MPIDLTKIPSNVGLPDEAEMSSIEARVGEVSTAFAAKAKTIQDAVDAARDKFNAEADAGSAPPPQGPEADGMTLAQRRTIRDSWLRAADKRHSEYRAALLEETRHVREDMLGQLQHAHDRLELAIRATPSPVAMLGMVALGSDQRARYESQLAGAGPATLGNAAIRAVATGDVVLGAAVLARLDAIHKDQRPVGTHELAEKLVGARHKQLTQRAERARIALSAARDADRLLHSGRVNSFSKISRGVAVRALVGATGVSQ